ncbi:MAG: hypothetical protein JSR77_04420 [Planctomycetes bacterium]|nr:hypothetical protein [Planctomycetota bacterium]
MSEKGQSNMDQSSANATVGGGEMTESPPWHPRRWEITDYLAVIGFLGSMFLLAKEFVTFLRDRSWPVRTGEVLCAPWRDRSHDVEEFEAFRTHWIDSGRRSTQLSWRQQSVVDILALGFRVRNGIYPMAEDPLTDRDFWKKPVWDRHQYDWVVIPLHNRSDEVLCVDQCVLTIGLVNVQANEDPFEMAFLAQHEQGVEVESQRRPYPAYVLTSDEHSASPWKGFEGGCSFVQPSATVYYRFPFRQDWFFDSGPADHRRVSLSIWIQGRKRTVVDLSDSTQKLWFNLARLQLAEEQAHWFTQFQANLQEPQFLFTEKRPANFLLRHDGDATAADLPQ